MLSYLRLPSMRRLCARGEDLGRAGDVTSIATVPVGVAGPCVVRRPGRFDEGPP
jgi:hypothetical protein